MAQCTLFDRYGEPLASMPIHTTLRWIAQAVRRKAGDDYVWDYAEVVLPNGRRLEVSNHDMD